MNLIAVVTFCLIWSSAFIVGKIGLQYTDLYTLLALRLLLAAMVLLPFIFKYLCAPNWQLIAKKSAIVGVFNNALYLALSFSALHSISPALVLIIVSCAPFMTTALATLLGLEPLNLRKLLGIGIGFTGVLLIVGTKPIGEVSWFGLLLAILATVSFSIGTVLHRKNTARFNLFVVNFWQSLAGGLLLLPFVWMNFQSTQTINPILIGAILYLAIAVTIGAMGLWLWLVRRNGAATAASYHLINPFFGLILAAIVFNEPIRVIDLVGVSVIVTGLWITLHTRAITVLEKK